MLKCLGNLIMLSAFGVGMVSMMITIFTFLWATWNGISWIVDVVEILVDGWIENPTIIRVIRIITRILCILAFPIFGAIAYPHMVTY